MKKNGYIDRARRVFVITDKDYIKNEIVEVKPEPTELKNVSELLKKYKPKFF